MTTATADDPSLLEALFEKVVARISGSSSSSATTTSISSDTKLRLYGLYKHCTVGPCPGGSSSWNPTEIAKQRAWQACVVRSKEEAQMEYVKLAASLDGTCQQYFEEYQSTKVAKKKKLSEKENKVEEEEEEKTVEKKEKLDHQSRGANRSASSTGQANDTTTSSLLQWLALLFRELFHWVLPKPVIPRGGLDVTWSDLWFALGACFKAYFLSTARRRQVEDQTTSDIQDLWNEEEVDIVVGYSVRSLLDLYLMHKQYPPQASQEVIVVPPINIPGMIQILEHYGLQVVPVDTPPHQVNVNKVDEAISDRTVAILVVHPFGNSTCSKGDWNELRRLADQHKLELWEDAAECYQGIPQFTGSPLADATFFSFGLIKTATALGGGIVILRGANSSAAANTLRRLQNHHYSAQTTEQYLCNKVLPAMLVQLFSTHPTLYGGLVQFCMWWGGTACLDRLVTHNLRSVKPGSNHNTMLCWIRKRPSLPLLQLLHRRLRQSPQTARTVQDRVQQCREMKQLMEIHTPNVPGLPDTEEKSSSTHWLFPIQVNPNKRQQVQTYLLQQGWDIAAGTSQLQCVLPTTTSLQNPAQAQGFMSKVLYLPVASRALTRQQCIDLAKCLERAVTIEPNQQPKSRRSINPTTISAVSALILALFIVNGRHSILTSLLSWILWLLIAGFVGMVVIACGLQWLGGSLYLESSTAFASYNSMVDTVCTTNNKDENDEQSTHQRNPPNAGVVESMPALKLPTTTRKLDKGLEGCVVLTGATGFVGSLILRDLLFHRKALCITAGVFVICRKKRSKSAQERINQLLNEDMFSFLTAAERQEMVHVLEGDVTQPNAGLSPQDLERLLSLPNQRKILTHIIHSAAAVSFTQALSDAARSNITSGLTMQALTRRLGQCMEEHESTRELPSPRFVHLSTAFVHGSGSGTQADPLPQSLFPLDPYDPAKVYESMVGTQFYASKAMSDLGFHNTYAFTKCVCEHLLLKDGNTRKSRVQTQIIRPSIVGPALEYPREGWAGQKPSTIVASGCLYLSYQWNLWCFGKFNVPCIPVDVLSRFVLKKAFQWEDPDPKPSETTDSDAASSEDSFEKVSSNSSVQSISRCSSKSQEISESCADTQRNQIYTAAWNDSSAATAMFTWVDYCGATLQLGAVMGYFYRSTAYIGLWVTSRLMPRFQWSFTSYETIHYHLVLSPMHVILYLCQLLGWESLFRKLSQLSSFLDLPLLFFPYMNETFHFESELAAPKNMDGRRYVFSCIVEAHRFLTKVNARNAAPKTVASNRMSYRVIGGKRHPDSCNLWWALTQPKGRLLVRLAGWMFEKILRATCYSLSVDLSSFEAVLEERMNTARSVESDEAVHLVLAPTHRSFLDFIIVSYVAFAIPELHIDIPMIAAADDFESLPIIGWLARRLGAFYLRRGRGRADPELEKTMATMKESRSAVFEVFIEGSRSRDRRFLEPRTGLLRSLASSGNRHLIVPISISYERIPEQDVLAKDAVGMGGKRGLNAAGLLRWLMDVARGKVSLGRIHVAAAEPSHLDCESSSEYAYLAKSIQLGQQQIIYCSEYHVRAAAKLLKLKPQTVRSAMKQIGCPFWPIPDLETSKGPELPEDPSELCTLLLHFGHNLAKLCPRKSSWRAWLNPAFADDYSESELARLLENPPATQFSMSLSALFSEAEARIETANAKLTANGFGKPNLNHLKMEAFKAESSSMPGVLLSAAASMYHGRTCTDDASSDAICDVAAAIPPQLLLDSEERLGSWGYHDSGFALQVNRKGSYYVSMGGNRYGISGKALPKLLPFVEEETCVQIDPFNEAFNGSGRPSSHVATESDLCEDELKLLQSTVGKMTVSVADRIRHGTGHGQEDICAIRSDFACSIRIPDAVVWPASEDELEGLIQVAKRQHWCLIPFGGGTNVTQATRCPLKKVEPRPIVSVDMTKMNRLVWLNEEDGLACFEAGINGRDLVAALEQRGYTMGHEPDSIEFSTLGGWIATKASGMKRNKYGNIEDIVRDVRVTGASGRISQRGGAKNQDANPVFGRESCGLDFRSLILGSEGCLGIITSAVVKVWRLPEVKEYESILFTSFEYGLGFVRDAAKLDRLIPASVRLLDNEHLRLGQALQADTRSFQERMLKVVKALLVAKTMATLDPKSVSCATICYEGNKAEVQLQKVEIQRLAKDHGGILLGPQVGKAGYDMTFVIAYLRDFALTYHLLGESFETFAPWSKVTSVIQKTKEKIKQEHESRCLPGTPFVGCRVTQLYHDGACLYFYLCMNTENVPEASRVFCEIEHIARSEILRQGGSLSHHHGIGKVRADFLKETTTDEFKKIVSSVKESMDPDNIFGAGNGLFGK